MEEDMALDKEITEPVKYPTRRALGMTDEEYQAVYWPQLREAVNQLLQGPPPAASTAAPAIEFERMYSAAYKCVCLQYSEQLYTDLINYVTRHFIKVACDMQVVQDNEMIEIYYTLIHRVMYSLDGIIPIFSYLNRVYVSSKLSSSLRTELQKLFCKTVLDPVIDRLLGAVREARQTEGLQVPPHVTASLVKNLHTLNPNYARQWPQIFSLYIPGVLPPMQERDLPAYISQTRELQASLRQSWTYVGSTGRKRYHDEEMTT